MFAEIVSAYVQLAETEQTMSASSAVPPAVNDPGSIPNSVVTTPATTNTQPVVPAPQAQEGVSQKEEPWMTGPNPDGNVIEVPVTPTIPPLPPRTD
jgi:hypothetical protein